VAKEKKIAVIKADWNDADYVHRITEVNDEDIKLLKRLGKVLEDQELEVLRMKQDEDEPKICEFSEKEWSRLSSLLPNGYEGNSIHTVDDVTIYTVTESKNII